MSDFWTPAHHAVEHEDAEALARLLASGSDPDEVFSDMTLLTHAIDTSNAQDLWIGFGVARGGRTFPNGPLMVTE
ncbi:hypothetical protein [Streptomyces sp. NBC_01276]|uniref:hypothetical protein n=1 Tax=Streptomyces sp. NBC_01276 TaxID=2903808 RepID=UPI00352DB42D